VLAFFGKHAFVRLEIWFGQLLRAGTAARRASIQKGKRVCQCRDEPALERGDDTALAGTRSCAMAILGSRYANQHNGCWRYE
jgi:hypothetical protein